MTRRTSPTAARTSKKPRVRTDTDLSRTPTGAAGSSNRVAAAGPRSPVPGPRSPDKAGVQTRAERVRAIVLDVDGVLTDAGLYYGRGGEAIKRFSARDGFAVVSAQKEGLTVAVLSGRLAPPLRSRLRDLHIPAALVIEGSRDKAGDVTALAERIGVSLEAVAFVGDDLPDLPALALVGLAACPADAAPEVKERCHLVCTAPGGHGVVREVVETVLKAQGRWQALVEAWLSSARAPTRGTGNRGPGTVPPPRHRRR